MIETEDKTRPQNGLEGIFFDFDGVLADSLDIKARAFLSLFERESGAAKQHIEAHFYEYTGRSRQEKLDYVLRTLLQRTPDTGEIERLAQQFRQRSITAVIECAEINGATRLLSALPQSLKAFVVSGTPETELVDIVQARGLSHYFLEVRGTPTRKEDNIADLLRRHRLDAHKCLMLGDGKVDQQAAACNNMPFIGVVAQGKVDPFASGTTCVSDLAELHRLFMQQGRVLPETSPHDRQTGAAGMQTDKK